MPWRKHGGASAKQGHGGEGTQAEMCGGWRGKGRHGDGQSHKADAHQSHSLPEFHCGGQNNGIHLRKWDWASPSLIILVYTLGRHRLITQLRDCATRRSFLCTAAGRRWINQRIFMCIQEAYISIFYCDSQAIRGANISIRDQPEI
jgi:hypothetical protein